MCAGVARRNRNKTAEDHKRMRQCPQNHQLFHLAGHAEMSGRAISLPVLLQRPGNRPAVTHYFGTNQIYAFDVPSGSYFQVIVQLALVLIHNTVPGPEVRPGVRDIRFLMSPGAFRYGPIHSLKRQLLHVSACTCNYMASFYVDCTLWS